MGIEALSIGDTNKVTHIVTDCDGVLTDGKYYYTENGNKLLTFSAKDSLAISLSKLSSIDITIVSSTSDTRAIEKRAKTWGINFYRAASFNKLEVISDLFPLDSVAYIGDSVDDIPVFNHVYLSFAPMDAMEQTRAKAGFILKRRGGDGCLLEVLLYLRWRNNDWADVR